MPRYAGKGVNSKKASHFIRWCPYWRPGSALTSQGELVYVPMSSKVGRGGRQIIYITLQSRSRVTLPVCCLRCQILLANGASELLKMAQNRSYKASRVRSHLSYRRLGILVLMRCAAFRFNPDPVHIEGEFISAFSAESEEHARS